MIHQKKPMNRFAIGVLACSTLMNQGVYAIRPFGSPGHQFQCSSFKRRAERLVHDFKEISATSVSQR